MGWLWRHTCIEGDDEADGDAERRQRARVDPEERLVVVPD